jgi:hypothetical protein
MAVVHKEAVVDWKHRDVPLSEGEHHLLGNVRLRAHQLQASARVKEVCNGMVLIFDTPL